MVGQVLVRHRQVYTGWCIFNKAQSPTALDAWRIWGQHAGLSVQQQELCLDPERSVP